MAVSTHDTIISVRSEVAAVAVADTRDGLAVFGGLRYGLGGDGAQSFGRHLLAVSLREEELGMTPGDVAEQLANLSPVTESPPPRPGRDERTDFLERTGRENVVVLLGASCEDLLEFSS